MVTPPGGSISADFEIHSPVGEIISPSGGKFAGRNNFATPELKIVQIFRFRGRFGPKCTFFDF
jgi:hypothetical protein